MQYATGMHQSQFRLGRRRPFSVIIVYRSVGEAIHNTPGPRMVIDMIVWQFVWT